MDVDDDYYGSSDGEYSETQMSFDGSSDGEFSETYMTRNVVRMGTNPLTVMVNEEGWTVSTPAHSAVTGLENSNTNDAHRQFTSNTSRTVQPTSISNRDSDRNTNTGAVPSIHGPSSSVTEITDIQHGDRQMTDNSRYPRTARFAEMLDQSDGQVMQDLMNALEDQLRGVEANNSAGAPVITNHIVNVEQSDTLIANHLHDSHGSTSNPHLSTPQSHHTGANTHTDTTSRASQNVRTLLTGPDAPPGLGRSNTTRHRYSVNFNSGSSGREGRNAQAGIVSIPQNDFMHLIRSLEGLSVNVQTLIDQGGSLGRTVPAINSPRFNIENIRRSLQNSEQEEAQPRIHRRKQVGENQVHDIMRNFLVEIGLRISRRRKQLILKETIPKSVVEGFEAGSHTDGPTLQDLRLDWTEPMTSLWNSTAIHLLATHVLERIRNNYYPQVTFQDWMTIDRFFLELKAKLATSREEYVNLLALNAPETDIGAAEGRARFAAKKSQKKVRNRRNMRRKTLYNCRLSIICENLGSDPAWENALRLMQVIGDSAMSDDETDNERSTHRKKVVRRVEKHWASASLKSMTNTLDLYYSRFYYDGNQKPGPGPRERLTTIASESPRGAPKSLPTNCYNNIFLNSLSPYQRSRLRCKRDMIIPVLPLPPA